MKRELERASEKAEFYLELARQRPTKLKGTTATSSSKWKTIFQKLSDLYVEESAKETVHEGIINQSYLLQKLMVRDKLNCLIVNLYPGNEGYSLVLKGRSGAESETMRLPYEESDLLQCINNEELLPMLVDLLDRSQVNMFYSGCVIVEVRDYSRSSNPATYECNYVLLKPTTQTLLCDVNLIASDSSKWTTEDKQLLESQLLLCTQEPLCLNPSVTVALIANKLQHNKNKFNTVSINRTAKKYSQSAINRKRKFEHCPAPPELKLYDFIAKRKRDSKSQATNLRLGGKPPVAPWREGSIEVKAPEVLEVEKYAKVLERPKTPEDDTPVLVEEYILESETNHGKISHTRLTIRRLPVEEIFVGELYIDKDYSEGVEKGTFYKFSFGTRDQVDKYIKQFTEIVTEEGRKSVKMTHIVPGNPPRVISTPGQQETLAALLQTIPQTSASPAVAAPSRQNATRSSSGNPNLMSPPLKPPSPGIAVMACASSNIRQGSRHASGRPSNTSPGLPKVTSPGSGDPSSGMAPPMSIAGMTMPTGLAVPISLAMMHATQSNIVSTNSPSGVLVSSIPGLMGTSTLNSTTTQGTNATTTVNSVGTPAVIVTSGMLSATSTVLAASPSVLSLPIGVSGSLNQLMASGLKGTPQGLRGQASPLSLLQVSGAQPTISLFGPLHRAQTGTLKTSNQVTSVTQSIISNTSTGRSGPTPPPATTSNTQSSLMTTLMSQQQAQAILAYPKQQVWQQQGHSQAPALAHVTTKPPPKGRKRSTSAATRDHHGGGGRNRDSKK